MERGILTGAAEFAHFRGISMFLQNSVLASDKGLRAQILHIWSGSGGGIEN